MLFRDLGGTAMCEKACKYKGIVTLDFNESDESMCIVAFYDIWAASMATETLKTL